MLVLFENVDGITPDYGTLRISSSGYSFLHHFGILFQETKEMEVIIS